MNNYFILDRIVTLKSLQFFFNGIAYILSFIFTYLINF